MYQFLKKWLLFALFVYILYVVFWTVAKPSQMSWDDFFVLSNEWKYVLYCTSFSLSSIVFCEVFMKVFFTDHKHSRMVISLGNGEFRTTRINGSATISYRGFVNPVTYNFDMPGGFVFTNL